jgi:HEAT repeat protein
MSPHRLALAATIVLALVAPAAGQRAAGDKSAVELIRALQGREFTDAFAAAETLGGMQAQRAQVVPALIEALRNREWATCGADVRDAIGRSLAQLKAREAMPALLELVKSGTSLEHECVE